MAEPADTPETPHVAGVDGQRRLHPLSWLFVLLRELRQFIVPLVALVVVGRSGSGRFDGNQWWPLIGVGVLAVISVWRYFTYRYQITADSVIVNSGLLHRSLRHIPFSRIHNVAIHQTLLHRLFGVAEVRLESAGGEKPEAEMRVLKLADANALEAVVRSHGSTSPAATATEADAVETGGNLLLKLSPADVLRVGLVSNRGMLVVGAAAAAASQMSSRILPNLFVGWAKQVLGYAGSHQFQPLDYALAGASLVLGVIVLLRLLSTVIALLQYHGFMLHEHGRRLTVERGLLTRLRTSASKRRLQAFTLTEGVIHRLLKRRTLDVDTAASGQGQEQRALRELAPVATPQACDGLLQHLLPDAQWPPAAWQPLHASAWWRLAVPGVVFALLLGAALGWKFGAWGLLGLLWLPWALLAARRHAQRAGYACDDTLVAVRGGWWSRHWRLAELDKLQALQIRQSPLDRRLATATLWLDTAGAGALSENLRVRFLPEAQARVLYARLSREIARRPLRW